MQAFLFLQLIVLMHFVPVEFFILEIKGYNIKKSQKKSCLAWWCGLTRLVPEYDFQLASRKLAFDIRFSRRSLALFLSLLFPHLSVFLSFYLPFYLSFFLCFCFVFPKIRGQVSVRSFILIFFSFILFCFPLFFAF